MDKTYTLAGTSRYKGEELTYRFATGNAKVREGILRRDGHTEVSFLELPRPMTLPHAVQWLNARGIRAVLPTGHRKREDERRIARMREEAEAAARREAEQAREQHDAHVAAHEEWVRAEAERKAAFVARMKAAREAKRAAKGG